MTYVIANREDSYRYHIRYPSNDKINKTIGDLSFVKEEKNKYYYKFPDYVENEDAEIKVFLNKKKYLKQVLPWTKIGSNNITIDIPKRISSGEYENIESDTEDAICSTTAKTFEILEKIAKEEEKLKKNCPDKCFTGVAVQVFPSFHVQIPKKNVGTLGHQDSAFLTNGCFYWFMI